ncbi:hypothetical protein [Streptosporangium sp. NPDC051022]|uniref:hypothetical protein n=1 Tax=Streptosporangium sp. NPDC051022 TaxID=3155752 RepID=UPI0034394024
MSAARIRFGSSASKFLWTRPQAAQARRSVIVVRHLVEDTSAHYVLIVKHNQDALLSAAMARLAIGIDADHEHTGTGHTETDRGYGHSERRTIRTAPAGGLDFPHAAQVIRIVRHVGDLADRVSARKWCTPSPACPPSWPEPLTWAATSVGTGAWRPGRITCETLPSAKTPAGSAPGRYRR